MIYFIKSGDAVKIGTTNDIFRRIKALQTGSPERLECVCILDGSYQQEHEMHVKFKESRLHEEWFAWDQTISDFVAEQTADGWNMATIIQQDVGLIDDTNWSMFAKSLRDRSGLSIRQAAELIGLSKTAYVSIENGQNPTLKSITAICLLYRERFTI